MYLDRQALVEQAKLASLNGRETCSHVRGVPFSTQQSQHATQKHVGYRVVVKRRKRNKLTEKPPVIFPIQLSRQLRCNSQEKTPHCACSATGNLQEGKDHVVVPVDREWTMKSKKRQFKLVSDQNVTSRPSNDQKRDKRMYVDGKNKICFMN